ncbi:hypothetical protein AB0H88_05245 [Nonomuraea sp. NPDC050680]|uniref:hypothetical protein n=1 Tax=Nonomuraea sp. NPDC050680 TaxID=3154630 RepID=UPI0033CCF09B
MIGRHWRTGAVIVLVALPTAVNLADDGLTWIWTRSLPGPLLHAIAWAGLLDAWLLLDLLAAVGVLGGAAVMAVAARRLAVATALLGLVAAVSLAAVPTGPEGCPSLWYGLAYAAASLLATSGENGRRARWNGALRRYHARRGLSGRGSRSVRGSSA